MQGDFGMPGGCVPLGGPFPASPPFGVAPVAAFGPVGHYGRPHASMTKERPGSKSTVCSKYSGSPFGGEPIVLGAGDSV